MISREDCMMLLTRLKNNGVDTQETFKQIIRSEGISLDVLKFINDNNPLDLSNFYESLRKGYNNKKSKVYQNIMKELNEDNIQNVLTTLNSYAQQILLFGKNAQNKEIFYRFARLSEVYQCLYLYSTKYELTPCIKLLRLIKADIKALETIYRNQQ